MDPLFRVRGDGDLAVVELHDADDYPDCVIIAPGGMAHRALAAMRSLLVEQEISCRLLVPSRLYPLDVEKLLPFVGDVVLVAEESTARHLGQRGRAPPPRPSLGPPARTRPPRPLPGRGDPHRRAPRKSGAGGGVHDSPRRTGGPAWLTSASPSSTTTTPST
ncbi:hypothetical protein ACFQX6_27995 [Streptosporangium lutulentum]